MNKPIIDNFIKDIEQNNYNSKRISFVNIDSRKRNTEQYVNSNDYTIKLNKNFNNVTSIKLKQIQFPNCIPPIINNTIKWIIPSKETFFKNAYPLASSTFLDEDIIYNVTLSSGFYTVKSLENELTSKMNNETYSDSNFSFNVNIDPNTHEVTFINRYEEIPICLIQTTLNSTSNMINTFFGPSNINKSNCVYVSMYATNTISNSFETLISNTYLPIVLTGMEDIGGIPNKLINNREFYNVNYLPPNYKGPTYKVLEKMNYYVTNNVANGHLNNYLYVIELHIKDFNNKEVYIKFNENKILDEFISEAQYDFETNNFTITSLNFQQIIGSFNSQNYPRIGRGMFYDFILDETSILLKLGWSLGCENTIIVSNKSSYQTIKSNLDFRVEDKVNFYIQNKSYITPTFPTNFFQFSKLNHTDVSIFSPEQYIYLVIEPNNIFGNSIIASDIRSIFCKIMLDSDYNLLINNEFIDNTKFFYDEKLNNFDSINIKFVDSEGNLLNLFKEHNFVLEITEILIKIKNTNINSRANDINNITII